MENSGRFLQGISCPIAYRPMRRQPTACRGINRLEMTYQTIFDVYPNPFENLLNIEIDPNIKQHITISLLDLTGKVVKQATLDTAASNLFSLPTKDIQNGLYILALRYGNQIAYRKIVCLNPF